MKVYPRKISLLVSFMLCLMPLWGQAEVNHAPERILSVFYPYRQGLPRYVHPEFNPWDNEGGHSPIGRSGVHCLPVGASFHFPDA